MGVEVLFVEYFLTDGEKMTLNQLTTACVQLQSQTGRFLYIPANDNTNRLGPDRTSEIVDEHRTIVPVPWKQLNHKITNIIFHLILEQTCHGTNHHLHFKSSQDL